MGRMENDWGRMEEQKWRDNYKEMSYKRQEQYNHVFSKYNNQFFMLFSEFYLNILEDKLKCVI